jgi:hypothetical protein
MTNPKIFAVRIVWRSRADVSHELLVHENELYYQDCDVSLS